MCTPALYGGAAAAKSGVVPLAGAANPRLAKMVPMMGLVGKALMKAKR